MVYGLLCSVKLHKMTKEKQENSPSENSVSTPRIESGCTERQMDVILQDKCDINFIYDDYDDVTVGLCDCRTGNLSLVAVAFKKTKQTFGTIDIVINNAGIVGEDKWETGVEVNVVRNKNIVCKTARNVCRIHVSMSLRLVVPN